jgi:rhodanese-related sulfurtransferase
MKITTLTPKDFQEAIQQDENILLIDVRQPEEWQQEHIADAKLLPLGEVAHKIQDYAQKSGQKIYLYCQRGRRSEQAGLVLLSLGYQDIYQLEGGLEQWKSAGFPCQDS